MRIIPMWFLLIGFAIIIPLLDSSSIDSAEERAYHLCASGTKCGGGQGVVCCRFSGPDRNNLKLDQSLCQWPHLVQDWSRKCHDDHPGPGTELYCYCSSRMPAKGVRMDATPRPDDSRRPTTEPTTTRRQETTTWRPRETTTYWREKETTTTKPKPLTTPTTTKAPMKEKSEANETEAEILCQKTVETCENEPESVSCCTMTAREMGGVWKWEMKENICVAPENKQAELDNCLKSSDDSTLKCICIDQEESAEAQKSKENSASRYAALNTATIFLLIAIFIIN